jgi:hypothetical protein
MPGCITYFPLFACTVNALKPNREGRDCGGSDFKWWIKLTVIKSICEDIKQ